LALSYCPGTDDIPVIPGLNLPSTGGTISHSFVSGIVFEEGERVCIINLSDPTGVPTNWLLRGYYTKP
jgi:hypothetical protein